MAIGHRDPNEEIRWWQYCEALAWWTNACRRMAWSFHQDDEVGPDALVEDGRGRKWRFHCELVKE